MYAFARMLMHIVRHCTICVIGWIDPCFLPPTTTVITIWNVAMRKNFRSAYSMTALRKIGPGLRASMASPRENFMFISEDSLRMDLTITSDVYQFVWCILKSEWKSDTSEDETRGRSCFCLGLEDRIDSTPRRKNLPSNI